MADLEKMTAYVESDLRKVGISFVIGTRDSKKKVRLRVCEEQLLWERAGRGKSKGAKEKGISWAKLIEYLKENANEPVSTRINPYE